MMGCCRGVFLAAVLFCNEALAEARGFSREFQMCVSMSVNIDSRASCIGMEVGYQKKRLNVAYSNIVKRISPEDKVYLDKVQRDWIVWRDGNYNFLSEHVAGEFFTTRMTSLNFLLNSVYDRADEIEMILDELGN